jgi:hypothetical protein
VSLIRYQKALLVVLAENHFDHLVEPDLLVPVLDSDLEEAQLHYNLSP